LFLQEHFAKIEKHLNLEGGKKKIPVGCSYTNSSPISNARADCVREPMEMKSTPV
jgi:hypothetical protein